MNYPLISEYVEAIKTAEENFEQLNHLRPVLDEDGEPVMTSGNFAVVFKMKDEQTGKLHAVKCFLKEQEGRAEAYRMIAEELEYVNSTFLTPIKYLDKELFVDSKNSDESEFPVLLMDWVEGMTLDKYIREHIDDQYELSLLAYQFSRLAMWLMPQPFAHGDLKPDNILVKNDGTLVLVDYDGMFVPAMKGQKARELGSPDFRHPNRKETDFDEHIDDFSLASILLSLKAISLQPSLLEEYGASDRLLFSKDDYIDLANCYLITEFYQFLSDKDFVSLYSAFLFAIAKQTLPPTYNKYFQIARSSFPKMDEEASLDLKDMYYRATNGDSSAQFELGCCYNEGHGVIKDSKKAAFWFLKAAKENREAMNNLGLMFEEGVSIKKDLNKAVSLYRASAENYCWQGQYNLARCYEDGIGVEQNLHIAIFWYKKIIEQQKNVACVSACYKLSLFYRIGLGVMPNKDEYNKYLGLAKRYDIYDGKWAHSNKEEGELPNPDITQSDYQDCFEDEYGVCYSKNGYRLLHAPANLVNYSVREGTKVVCKEAFSKCANSLVSISFPKSLLAIAPNSFAGCSSLCNIDFGFDSLLCLIGAWAFSGCTSLKKLDLPNHITCIGPGAFAYCNNLKDVFLPISLLNNFFYHFSVDGRTLDMPYNYKNYFIFEGCSSLKVISVPNKSAEKFKEFIPASMNIQITDTPDLGLLSKLSELAKKRESSFNNTMPKKETSPNWIDDSGVKYCSDKKQLIKAPSKIKNYSIKEGTVVISDRAFYLCQSLESIIFPTSITSIGDSAFCGCKQLTAIEIPQSVRKIGDFSFAGCTLLNDLILHEGLTNIGGSAFKDCTSLRTIFIPNSVDTFGDIFATRGLWIHANRVTSFDGCSSLHTLYIPIGTKRKFEKLLPEYKDKLVEQEMGWIVKNTRSFDPEEIAAVKRAEVVASQYGNSVCFFMNGGGQTYIPLCKQSKLAVGDELDLRTAKILTLSKKGKDDITRVIE